MGGWVPASQEHYLQKLSQIAGELPEEDAVDPAILVCAMCVCGGWLGEGQRDGWVFRNARDFCGELCASAYAAWEERTLAP